MKLVGDDDAPMTDVHLGAKSSWARFAPEQATVGDDTYYALAFSSGRGPGELDKTGAPYARMFFAFLKRDASGAITRVGMTLVPGQTFDAHNLTLDARPLASVKAPAAIK